VTGDSFQDWLCLSVREVLGHHSAQPPLLLWCDPDRAWLDLLREAASANGFELWAPEGTQDSHELLVRDRFYSTPRAPRVVWLPCRRDAITWFKPFELEAEEVWVKSLLTALREYGVEISRDHEDDLIGLLPAHAREWFDKPKDTWRELTPGNAKGTLVDDHRMLQALAGPAGEFERLREEGRLDIFARRATEDFGWPDPKTQGEEPWRIATTARLLCTEAAEGSPRDQPRESDKIIAPGLQRTHSLRLLKQWQNDIRYIASFESLVPKAEATVGLTYWARNLSSMPRSWSSRTVEETLFAQAADRLDRLEEVDVLAEELARDAQTYKDRERQFWGRAATSPVGWRYLVELAGAAALLIENQAVEESWKTVGDSIEWYGSRGWQLDHAGEQLFKESADLPMQLHRIRARLRRGYRDLPAGTFGVSTKGKIMIQAGLDPADGFAVLAHELAHELLHQTPGEGRASKCIRETEAEAVAHVVCHAFGLDSTQSSVDYIQLYDGDLAALNGSLQAIQTTAAQILVEMSRAEAVYWARQASFVAA
jgi:hypothetical protein